MDEPCGIPCGFLVVKLATSETMVHAPRTVTLSWFEPLTRMRIVNKGAPPLTFQKCENPPDPVDAKAAWRKRLADYQAIRERREVRAENYLNQRSARR
jgi:hypothetical protein